jgi:choline dehydrogenase-like flavoprotein
MNQYDTIVIGAGAGGGIAAAVLAEAGFSVLLLERGRALATAEIPRDHLRNHRVSLYGINTGPSPHGHPRVLVDPSGKAAIVQPHEGGYHNNAMTLGGGTRVYGMQAWRFNPDDFRMAARYGVPKGSSLADWPIGYYDLAPYYERAEWEIGVTGGSEDNPFAGPRSRGFPLPPVPPSPESDWLRRAAARLGWEVVTPPLLLNSGPRQGRAACTGCSECIGFACHVDAKNGAHNTVIPRALATGLCELATQAHVASIDTDLRGRVEGVSYFQESEKGVESKTARARIVIAAAGAIETARLMLHSSSTLHPFGLGNRNRQVGRHLQGHYYTGAYGLMPPEIEYTGRGPGVNIATTKFNHGNPGIVGGALLANEFVTLPIGFWRSGLPPDTRRWGLANKRAMREGYRRGVHVQGPVQEIPQAGCRVALDPSVRDKFDLPVARLCGTTHPETLQTTEFIRGKAEEWLRAAGAEKVWSWPRSLELSAGQHQAGTCRMGDDPAISVTDRHGRVHGHDNLFVADGSVHVTNGGFNPVLTIMALAYRTAEFAARSLR